MAKKLVKRNVINTLKTARKKPNGFMNVKKVISNEPGNNGANKNINESWCKVDGTQIEDVSLYIKEYLSNTDKYDTVRLMIGTDGLAIWQSKTTVLIKIMTVIVLYKVGKGAHIIKRRESHFLKRQDSELDAITFEKLNMEADKTIELALYLREKIGIDPEIHMDLNPSDLYKSNKVYQVVHGYPEGLGFKTKYKSVAHVASIAADHFL